MYLVLFALAALLLVLTPWAPQLIRLRLRFFRWIGWDWAANLVEKYFNVWVWIVRIALPTIAAILLYTGWEQLQH